MSWLGNLLYDFGIGRAFGIGLLIIAGLALWSSYQGAIKDREILALKVASQTDAISMLRSQQEALDRIVQEKAKRVRVLEAENADIQQRFENDKNNDTALKDWADRPYLPND